MNLKVITPEKIFFDGTIQEVIVPTPQGEIAILPGHVNLLTQVSDWEITINSSGKNHHLAVMDGFLQIQRDEVSLISDFAIRSEEIDSKKALDAQKQAQERIQNAGKDNTEQDLALAQAQMRRAILQLKVHNRRRGGL